MNEPVKIVRPAPGVWHCEDSDQMHVTMSELPEGAELDGWDATSAMELADKALRMLDGLKDPKRTRVIVLWFAGLSITVAREGK